MVRFIHTLAISTIFAKARFGKYAGCRTSKIHFGNVTTKHFKRFSNISYEEQRNLKKQVHQLEKEIATIEKQLEKVTKQK